MARLLWTQKQDIGPKPRIGHSLVFDAARNRVVLFGGDALNGALFNDTWEWDGEDWTQVADMGPRPRAFHSLAYDSIRQRTVLFGGADAETDLRDTWEWDGENWTQVADTGPSSRSKHAMAFDKDRAQTVLFSGSARNSAAVLDTWGWDGSDWTQIEDTGPPPRTSHVLAYDTNRKRLVLFGGSSPTGPVGDTWEWNGSTWTEVAHFGPEACASAAGAFSGSRVELFGGVGVSDGAATVFGSTWEWDGKHWTQRQDIGPGPRWGHALAYDSARNRVVLFGGLPVFAANPADIRDGVFGDTWEHAPTSGPTVAAVSLTSIVITPPALHVGQTVNGSVALSGPAPEGGVTVSISSNLADNDLWFGTSPGSISPGPKAIVIPANASGGAFACRLHSAPVFGGGSATITATLAGMSRSITVSVSAL